MSSHAGRQRSFRLSERTLAALDEASAASGETRNALVERLLAEPLRIERHPYVRFAPSVAGSRRAMVIGTRLSVDQVMATVRSHGGDVAATAEYFSVDRRLVDAAVDYYADFGAEIDAAAALAADLAAAERRRFDQRRQVLAGDAENSVRSTPQ